MKLLRLALTTDMCFNDEVASFAMLTEADLLVFLVAHSSFKGLGLIGREVFDLCDVTKQF